MGGITFQLWKFIRRKELPKIYKKKKSLFRFLLPFETKVQDQTMFPKQYLTLSVAVRKLPRAYISEASDHGNDTMVIFNSTTGIKFPPFKTAILTVSVTKTSSLYSLALRTHVIMKQNLYLHHDFSYQIAYYAQHMQSLHPILM
jgi:hypothetical protein